MFDPNGTVTAGNAPSINDGGAAVVVMSKEKADELGVKHYGQLLDMQKYLKSLSILLLFQVYQLKRFYNNRAIL